MQLLNDGENLVDENRGKPHGGFVHEQDLGVGHQRAPGREHLLFAAGERAAELAGAFLEPWEMVKHLIHIVADAFCVINNIRPHTQVFLYRHARKNMASFGNMRKSHVDDVVGGHFLQAFAV